MPKPKLNDRVRMTGIIRDDPVPTPIGSEGTVRMVLNEDMLRTQVVVEMDNGSTLLLLSTDPYEIIPQV